MTLRVPFSMTPPQTPLIERQGLIGKDWYILLVSIYNAVTQGLNQAGESLAVDASPLTYQAVIKGQAFVMGGAVSAIEYSRDGTNYFPAVSPVQMAQKDYLRVTYSVAPTITFFPM